MTDVKKNKNRITTAQRFEKIGVFQCLVRIINNRAFAVIEISGEHWKPWENRLFHKPTVPTSFNKNLLKGVKIRQSFVDIQAKKCGSAQFDEFLNVF